MNKPYNVDDILNPQRDQSQKSAKRPAGQTCARKTGRKSRPRKAGNLHRNRSPAR